MSITIRPLKAPGNGEFLWQDEDVDVNAMSNNDILAFQSLPPGSIESNGVPGAWVNKTLTLNGASTAASNSTTQGGLIITHTGSLAYSLSVDNSVIRTSPPSGNTQTIGGNVVFNGDVTVNGTTTITTRDISTGENIILLNADWPNGTQPTQPGGIYVYRGNLPGDFTTGVIWDEATDQWVINNRTGVDPSQPDFPTIGGGTSIATYKIWNAGNDGSGSGLDADLLDGQQGNFYTSATNMISGTLPSGRLSGTYDINVTGNAATATKLQTARDINGVPFDGTQNIDITDPLALPLAGGVMTGNYSEDIIPGAQGVTTVKRPVAFTSNQAAITGTIKISLPVGMSNSMLRIRIVGYNYSANTGAWEITVGGYNYAADNMWHNTNVISSGDIPFSNVRLGLDTLTGKSCILLGTTSTVNAYPKIVVEDVVVGYSNVSSATWRTGWSISLTTNETGISLSPTPVLKTITDFGYTVTGSADAATARTALDVYGTAETYNKTETYSKAEVNALINAVAQNLTPLFTVQWWPSRAAIPVGYVPADGQTLSRTTYATAWAGIAAGNVPSVADGTWTSGQVNRGMYTPGNNTTTFRVPDYNGKSSGSMGAAFLRGDGLNSAGTAGIIQADDIISHTHTEQGYRSSPGAGQFGQDVNYTIQTSTTGATGGVETRPVNVTGCWIIKIEGTTVATYTAPPGNYSSLTGTL